MKQEDKELLLKDLSARLLYGVKVQVEYDAEEFGKTIEIDEITMIDKYGEEILLYHASEYFNIEELKPYLRPLTSMTEKEIEIYHKKNQTDRLGGMGVPIRNHLYRTQECIDWLIKNHFDFRGLIGKRLAIKVTPDNNPYKRKRK